VVSRRNDSLLDKLQQDYDYDTMANRNEVIMKGSPVRREANLPKRDK